MKKPPANIITYNYKFVFNNGLEREFNVKLDSQTLDLIQPSKKSYPEWTKLICSKCPNCPLDEKEHKFCPAAVAIIDMVIFFKELISYEEVDVLVEARERRYAKHISLQKGLGSLMGIYMVTCGCPIMEKLKPMVRYHLPFATVSETRYRADINVFTSPVFFMQAR